MSDSADTRFAPLGGSFRVQLTMKSDWHVGSGTGRPGDVDRLIRRDEDGLPYVPAKTLTGVWRDACERVAVGLDNGIPGVWSRWVRVLFGEQPGHPTQDIQPKAPHEYERPIPAALSVRAARLPESLRGAIAHKPAVSQAVTFVKPGVSISARTGRAIPKHLRFEELARIGATLEADCEIDWSACENEDQRLSATALLVAGAQMVERVGGKRRRGSGRCELAVVDSPNMEQTLGWISGHQGLAGPQGVAGEICEPLVRSEGGEWRHYSLSISTEAPLIIATRATGNLVETADYIPATYLLPVISGKLRAVASQAGVDLDAAIVGGGLAVTNATVEIDNQPGRPVPFSLFHEKSGDGLSGTGRVYNRLRDYTAETPQLKGYRSGYIGRTSVDSRPSFLTVLREVETHNVVKDDIQRPHEDVGGVFAYQAIKANTRFRAELSVRKPLAEKLNAVDLNWFQKLAGSHRLGRSKKDDYGLVCIEVEPSQDETTDFQQVVSPDNNSTLGGNDELVVWLLSDLLLRDVRLRPSVSIDRLRTELEKRLNVSLQVREDKTARLPSHISRQNRIDSWHVGWGLPRPSLAGLAAGTCVVFTVRGDCDVTALEEIEETGLGERVAEGYGRISFNDTLLRSSLENLPPPGQPGDSASGYPVNEASLIPFSVYARLIEREAVRREIVRLALQFAEEPEGRGQALGIEIRDGESRPPLSQLGALRSVAARLRGNGQEDKDVILRWVRQLEHTPNRLEKWPDAARTREGVAGQELSKIRELIERADTIWNLLNIRWNGLVITDTGQADLSSELWAEAVRALVDACIRKQKREVEKARES
ncbi:MAG TPA: RAMP superfamily CRISPR-associated protein [Blastocatellia bacterium]|nr:RAMP superfamily CRISPR-associated protein [Blastocatellia bacterium]